jgi:single stranded DNA-binding protein
MVNLSIIVGHLGHDASLRYDKNDKPFLKFSVATSEKSRDGDKLTTWHHVVTFGPMAEKHQVLRKGELVSVDGRRSVIEYLDMEGVPQRREEIVARVINPIFDRPASHPASHADPYSCPDDGCPF